MVIVAGWHIGIGAKPQQRDWMSVALAIGGGLMLAYATPKIDALPTPIASVVSFPVSSGAFIAMLLEMSVPRPANGE